MRGDRARPAPSHVFGFLRSVGSGYKGVPFEETASQCQYEAVCESPLPSYASSSYSSSFLSEPRSLVSSSAYSADCRVTPSSSKTFVSSHSRQDFPFTAPPPPPKKTVLCTK